MSDAMQRSAAFTARVHASINGGPPHPPGLRIFGVGQAEVMRRFDELERRTRHSVWSLNPRPSFDPEDIAYSLENRSRARGVDIQLITPARTLRLNPLLTSLAPTLRIGPALSRATIVDRSVGVVEGPDTPSGDATAWLVTGGDLLADLLDLWDTSFAESHPALAEGAAPPLNARQLDVARGVCLGRTDAVIARQLGISERTVARDLAAILEVTDARSRGEAILNMLGRGRQSRS